MAQLLWSSDGGLPWSKLIPLTSLDVTTFVLAGLYFSIVIWPLVQLIRLNIRAPDAGWTTQKIFFILTMVANLFRTVFFALSPFVRHKFFFAKHDITRYTVFTLLDDIPADVFFTTYTLLILFWGEVIQHAKKSDASEPPSHRLRIIFIGVNAAVYFVQIILLLLIGLVPSALDTLDLVDNSFFALISAVAAVGFVVFGGRLYFMLKGFPIASKSREKKLREVGLVAVVCTVCFTVRAIMIVWTMFVEEDASFLFVGGFFLFVEILPSVLVLFMLRHLPPRKRRGHLQHVNTHTPPPATPTNDGTFRPGHVSVSRYDQQRPLLQGSSVDYGTGEGPAPGQVQGYSASPSNPYPSVHTPRPPIFEYRGVGSQASSQGGGFPPTPDGMVSGQSTDSQSRYLQQPVGHWPPMETPTRGEYGRRFYGERR